MGRGWDVPPTPGLPGRSLLVSALCSHQHHPGHTHTLGPTLGIPPGSHSAWSGSRCTGEAPSSWALLPEARPPPPTLGWFLIMSHDSRGPCSVALGGGLSGFLWVGGSVSLVQKKGMCKPGGHRPRRETTPFRQKPPLSLQTDCSAHIRRVGTPRKECHNCSSAACSAVGRQARLSPACPRWAVGGRLTGTKATGSAAHQLSDVGQVTSGG